MKNSIWATLAFAVGLLGCQSEGVAPAAGGSKGVAGAMGDIHPMMDSICAWSDTIYFQGDDGSTTVNKCGWEDDLPAPIACSTPQEKWGYMRVSNGYAFEASGNTEWVGVEFSLPYGWYCQTNRWKFADTGGMAINSQTGKPTVGNDWSVVQYSPVRGEWKIALPLAQLPNQNAFDMACKLLVSPIDINGVPMTAYSTDLWAAKTPSGVGANPFVIGYAPVHCLSNGGGGCPTAAVSTQCETVYKGLTCSGGIALASKTLVPDAAGAGSSPIYNWSTGVHTSSLTVNPTTTTTYTCTVTNGTCAIRVVTFNVNVIDAGCLVTLNTTTPVSQSVSFAAYNAGQRITNQLSSQGVSSVNASGGLGQAWIFDSANPTGGDTDLGSPNQAFGGPGIGIGGATSNNTALGKLIIIQEKVGAPSDNATGGTLNFNFASPRKMTSITLVDIESTGGFIRLARTSGAAVTIPIPVTGDNGVVTMTLNTENVTQLRVRLTGSGAVAGFTAIANVVTGTTQVAAVRVCDVPPGKPTGAVTYCVEYDDLNMYIDGVCGNSSSSGKPGSYLGVCGSNPCNLTSSK